MLGVYIHIPFCRPAATGGAKCNYCDFYSEILSDDATNERFIGALQREILSYKNHFKKTRSADTIYFGGGTPSLISPRDIDRTLCACSETFAIARNGEITLEANPEDISAESAREFRSAGITRLSIGVQSLNDKSLKMLGRRHSKQSALSAIRFAKDVFENISVDIICALPAETLEDWRATIDGILKESPQHISMYILEIHEGTALARAIDDGKILPTDDDSAAEMFHIAREILEGAGYEHYEISNFAKRGFASRHNLKYWSDEPYIGFGPSAHSYFDEKRREHISKLSDYITAIENGESPIVKSESLSRERIIADRIILGMRKIAGYRLSEEDLRYISSREASLEKFQSDGLIERNENTIRLTKKGVLLSNSVFEAFI